MATTNDRTVVGVFEDRRPAEAAMDELRHSRFTADQIGFVSRHQHGTAAATPTAREEGNAEEGAVTGAVAGGALGALAGAVAVGLIPGVGQVIAGGILLGVLGGAAAGAALGTYLGPFIGMGLSEDEARAYARELNEGRTIVTVRAAADTAEHAADVLRRYGATRVQVAGVSQPGVEEMEKLT
jgi:hypothetical protein